MVTGQLYQIVFEGKLTGEIELDKVKNSLAAMFKMNASQVEALFSGKPIVIKRNVDDATAKKYKAAFAKAGAQCTLLESNASPASDPTPPPASKSEDRPDGRFAGKDIVNKKIPADLSGLSMGQVGEPIPTLEAEDDFELPDLSALSMSQDESFLVKPTEKPEPKVDISGLSVEDID